jgi:predicted ATPase/class 3 adenylate cyclase
VSDLPSGTVTFLFTDIEGSTALWERDRRAMASAVARHLALLHAAIAAHGGVHFKTVGDAVQAAFPTAPDALTAALDAQQALLAEDWGEIGPLRVRMALHAGEAEPDQRGDYLSAPLNRLSRLLATGHGGQILLTQTVQQLSRGGLPPGTELRDLGEHRLRDLLDPERVYQLLHPDLPDQFPPLRTLEGHPNNLPRQPTPFLGREQAVAEMIALLRREDVQLVTLTGPGGTGKTRLALQVAAELLDAFPDGVYFVDLAALSNATLVPETIAQVLNIRADGVGAPLDALVTYVRDKQILLLLDNFEHLLPAAPVVGELLRGCPNLTVLATSRAPLRLRAEREVPVPPLTLPDPTRHEPLERLTQYEAVRLFIDRAMASKPDFRVDNENASAVVGICTRLDGLPLAIELAAARVRMLPAHALLRRLEHRLPLLTSGARDAPQRQRTLRDAIAWSHDLLSNDEQTLFRRLGVFAGGCTLELAEAVINPEGSLDVFAGLASLVEEGLLRQATQERDEPRFRMLETIREFALEHLTICGDEYETRGQLAGWFLGQVPELEVAFDTGVPVALIAQLEADYPNLVASLDWLAQAKQADALLRLMGALTDYWYTTGRFREGRDWAERALASAAETRTPARARTLYVAGHLAHRLGEDDTAVARLTAAAALAHELELPQVEAHAMLALGIVEEDRGAYDVAEDHLLAASELYRRVGYEIDQLVATYHLGVVAYGRGEVAQARQVWQDVLADAKARDDAVVAAWCLLYLGMQEAEHGVPAAAASALREYLALSQISALRHHQGDLLDTVAVLGTACGLFAIAARLQGAASVVEWHTGRAELPERSVYERTEARLRNVLGEAVYLQAWEHGAAFRPEETSAAVAAVLDAAEARAQRKDNVLGTR